jgi:hypothetical protein
MPIKDRYCEACGADQWNPPQGPAARPGLIRGDYVRDDAATPTSTSTITAAGVTILATLSLLSFWFWFAIGVQAIANKPDAEVRVAGVGVLTFADYVTGERIMLALVASVVLAGISWSVALNIVGDD